MPRIITWGFTTVLLNKLQIPMQNKMLRIMDLKCLKDCTNISFLFNLMNILKIKDICELRLLWLCFCI